MDGENLTDAEWRERLRLAHEVFEMFKHEAYKAGEI